MECEDNGHDSGTCNCCTSIRLFGVQIDIADGNLEKNGESLRKSKSLGNLEACNAENTPVDAGYLSDGFMPQSSRSKDRARNRKRGRPWSEKEHRCFLVGLEKLGKGDWKGISKNYVPSRNSSQVASHAQKYFIRLSATENNRRRRWSVFDIPLAEEAISSDDALKNLGEFERQASMQPHVTSEKPPLSPMPKRHGINKFRRVAPYMAGVSCINQSFLEHRKTPTVSWLSIVNYQNLIFPTRAPFMPQPESSILGPIHQGASFQAGPSTGVTKNNALNLS